MHPYKFSMNIVNSNLPANLFVSAPSPPVGVQGGVQLDLRVEQLVRATVIEAKLERSILEINRQHYLAQGERELRVGQKLNLQVLQTQPRLEFKVLSDSLTSRLSQALPLLTRPFDWGKLVSQLRQQPEQPSLPQATLKVYSQLQQILDPTAGVPVDLKENIALIVAQLQHLSLSVAAASAKEGDALLRLSADIKQLLDQVQQGQRQDIVPELLGRLEGLLGRLQQLSLANGAALVLLPGFEAIISQLSQLVAQPASSPQGGELGLLSQLFGFHLEKELLQGKKRAALAGLKLSLLNLQKELGGEVKEPLRRIELFQLCKAKLAEEQVQFLPLPFNQLEEGYLLAEKRSEADEDNGEVPLQMSLSLRLSALGNIRIDMLYEKGGLHLRLAGEDREKMSYLQNCTNELKESLQAIELQGINFSADAQLPARQLQERLLPDSANILDARV